MQKSMKSIERVRTALAHQEPDRVPLGLWGSYYTLNDDTYFQILKYLKLGDPVVPFRRYLNRNSNYYDDRVLERLETDMRYVWSGFTDLGGARPDTLIDAWGVQWKRIGPHITSSAPPLAGAHIEQVEEYSWPDVEKYLTIPALKERIKELKKSGEHAIVARAVNSYGPFEQASVLRGREQFYMDLILEPELAQRLIDRCTDVIVRLNEIYVDLIGYEVDMFEIPGDDYGGTEDLLISPEMFDDMIKPALSRIIQPIKQFRKDLPVAFHTDGAVMKIVDRLVEIGVDVLNPLEPLPSNDWEQVKRLYGDRLCFMGGIDIKKAMTGPVKGVDEEVKRCMKVFAPGGGYIMTPSNHLQKDVPPENIALLYEFGKKYGQYPISSL
jgi:uroporphyrinogen decarboxylase